VQTSLDHPTVRGIHPDDLAARVRRRVGRLRAPELHRWLIAEGLAVEDERQLLYATRRGFQIAGMLDEIE
jgi:hypothetical protein